MFNSKKECFINFTTTTNGLFEIITPVMDGDELFDANLLEQTINTLISQGKRNFALDLSNIEYIYSDSINKFINLNHKVLNIYGRLSLLSPQEEVAQILQRAGIQNFITIHDSKESLMKASQEMIQQTTTINVAEMQNQQPQQQPAVQQSEFDELRSEIGNAMDIEAPATEPETGAYQVDAPVQDSAFGQQQPAVQPAPQLQQQQPVPTQPEQSFEPQQAEQQTNFAPDTSEDYSDPTEQYAERFEEEGEKKSGGMPVAVILLLVVSLLAVVSIVGFIFMGQSKSKSVVKSTPTMEKIVKKDSDLPEIKDVPDMDDPVLSPEKKIAKPTKSVTSTNKKPPTRKSVSSKKSSRKPLAKKSSSKKRSVAKTTTAKKGGIVITSSPAGAKVMYNKKVLGITPYTWKGSLPYGMIAITVVKDGYKDKKMNFEYTGVATKKNFVLAAKPKVKKPAPAPVKTTPAPVAKPATPAPAPVSATPKGKPGTIFISSLPPMADVYMDGVKIGKTNIAELKIIAGAHEMKFVKGAKQLVKKMSFTPGLNKSQLIRLK